MTQTIEGEEVRFKMLLEPETEQTVNLEGDPELKLSLKDDKNKALKGIAIAVEMSGDALGVIPPTKTAS